ncbi:transglycosylase SLT domain-containing protein [Luteimonas fraxinea]|uniref:lytic transglycosylase domain-containing protein n=1 Tax=Luteimonas fraxinea TaxID=2901869 RepID=UPI003CCDA9E0
MEMMACADLAVPAEVMHHVAKVESSFNPFAIGVVGGRLARQPRSLGEALSTARMLEQEGYNFSLGIAQVNRYNLDKQGLDSYEKAFDICPNVQAGSRILAECYGRSGQDWGKAFSCYYSGNFTTGFRHGYVQKVVASWQGAVASGAQAAAIPVIRSQPSTPRPARAAAVSAVESLIARRVAEAAASSARQDATQETSRLQPAPVDAITAAAPAAVRRDGAGAGASPAAEDGPVVVQLVGAPRPSAPPPQGMGAPAPSTQPAAVHQAPPARDSAFVF